jgi:hypothetical protein
VLQVQQQGRRADDADQLLAAADLLADAIRAGRLPRKPPMETLARIAAIIVSAKRETPRSARPVASGKVLSGASRRTSRV